MDRLDRYVDECRSRLITGLTASSDGALVAGYFRRGKMIRSLIVFASASAVGSDPARATYAAEAIELLHGASLFHDDLLDGADERRGLPALHHRVSQSAAVLLGDFLLLRAFSVLCESRVDGHAGHHIVDAVQVLGEQAQACCHGQHLELALTNRPVSESEYFTIVDGKTAAPFMAAAALGVIMGDGTDRDREQLTVFARHLGVAFQICDDMLDLSGERESLGKPVGNSLAQGRPFLPFIYLQTYGSCAARTEWEDLRRRGASGHELLALLRRERIAARVEAMQTSHVGAALAALDGLPDSMGLQTLRELPTYALVSWA
jgi:geranylgeranyl pyrophosphate synthase